MTRRRFPRTPGTPPRPFDDGHNPFADDVVTPVPPSDNPFTSPESDGVQPFSPVEFEVTQFDRSYKILALGGVGAAFVAASLAVTLVILVRSAMFSTELAYGIPADLLGLALSIPAWTMATADCRAIRAGVMDAAAWQRTRAGWWCGALGTLFGLFPVAAIVYAIGRSFFV